MFPLSRWPVTRQNLAFLNPSHVAVPCNMGLRYHVLLVIPFLLSLNSSFVPLPMPLHWALTCKRQGVRGREEHIYLGGSPFAAKSQMSLLLDKHRVSTQRVLKIIVLYRSHGMVTSPASSGREYCNKEIIFFILSPASEETIATMLPNWSDMCLGAPDTQNLFCNPTLAFCSWEVILPALYLLSALKCK